MQQKEKKQQQSKEKESVVHMSHCQDCFSELQIYGSLLLSHH